MAFKWDWDVSLGHILIAVPLLITATAYIVTDHNSQTTLSDKVDRLQVNTDKRFDELSRQVSGLPDETATVHQLDNRVTRLEATKTDRDAQINALSLIVASDHTDLEVIKEANRQKLGGR